MFYFTVHLRLATLCVAAALLTSCGGGSNITPGPNSNSGNAGHAPRDPAATPLLYVPSVNRTSSASGNISAFRLDSNGNTTPVSTLTGANTFQPTSVAFDSHGNMYVDVFFGSGCASLCTVPGGDGIIMVFAPGASGNAAPIRTICGPHTKLALSGGIAIDSMDRLYVTNEGTSAGPTSVTIYAAGASGDVAPIASISGPSTQLDLPHTIAVDAAGTVYVGNLGPNEVTEYAPGANGDAPPSKTIATGGFLHGVAVDTADNLYVVGGFSAGGGYLDVFAPGQTTPTRMISGSNTQLEEPAGVAIDSTGTAYVANAGPENILVFAATANGNVSPTREFNKPYDGLDEAQPAIH